MGDDARGAGPPRASALSDVLIARLEAAYVSVPADLPALPRMVEESGVLWQRVRASAFVGVHGRPDR